MDLEREIEVRDAIKYCIEIFDSETATNRIVEFWKDELKLQERALRIHDVGGSLPSKDEVVDKGYTKAKNADYNYRRSLRDLDHDLYFSGWMDCYDWLSGTDR